MDALCPLPCFFFFLRLAVEGRVPPRNHRGDSRVGTKIRAGEPTRTHHLPPTLVAATTTSVTCGLRRATAGGPRRLLAQQGCAHVGPPCASALRLPRVAAGGRTHHIPTWPPRATSRVLASCGHAPPPHPHAKTTPCHHWWSSPPHPHHPLAPTPSLHSHTGTRPLASIPPVSRHTPAAHPSLPSTSWSAPRDRADAPAKAPAATRLPRHRQRRLALPLSTLTRPPLPSSPATLLAVCRLAAQALHAGSARTRTLPRPLWTEPALFFLVFSPEAPACIGIVGGGLLHTPPAEAVPLGAGLAAPPRVPRTRYHTGGLGRGSLPSPSPPQPPRKPSCRWRTHRRRTGAPTGGRPASATSRRRGDFFWFPHPPRRRVRRPLLCGRVPPPRAAFQRLSPRGGRPPPTDQTTRGSLSAAAANPHPWRGGGRSCNDVTGDRSGRGQPGLPPHVASTLPPLLARLLDGGRRRRRRRCCRRRRRRAVLPPPLTPGNVRRSPDEQVPALLSPLAG